DWFGGCVAHDAGQLFPVFLAGGVGLGRLVGLCAALGCTLSAHRLEVAPQVPVCESRDVGVDLADLGGAEPGVSLVGLGLDLVDDGLCLLGGGVGACHDGLGRVRGFFGRRRIL